MLLHWRLYLREDAAYKHAAIVAQLQNAVIGAAVSGGSRADYRTVFCPLPFHLTAR